MEFLEYMMYDCFRKGMSPEDTVARYFRFGEFQNLCADTYRQITNKTRKQKRKGIKKQKEKNVSHD